MYDEDSKSMIDLKNTIRNSMKERRKQIKKEARYQFDLQIASLFIDSKEYKESKILLIYVAFLDEVETRKIIQDAFYNGKLVFVPKVLSKDRMEFFKISDLSLLVRSNYGIMEPVETNDTSFLYFINQMSKRERQDMPILMCLPGIAFDKEFNRLGYGGGYYDRYIQYLEEEQVLVTKMGLAYENQFVDVVPTNGYDKKLDVIVMNSCILRNQIMK